MPSFSIIFQVYTHIKLFFSSTVITQNIPGLYSRLQRMNRKISCLTWCGDFCAPKVKFVYNDAKYCQLSPFMYLVFILKWLLTCAPITESLRPNNSFFQENGEAKEIPQLNRPYGQINMTCLFCPEWIDSCKWAEEWQRKLQTPIYFTTFCCVNVKQRVLAASEQHSLRKQVVKAQIQRSTFYNFFSWYCSSIKSTLQCQTKSHYVFQLHYLWITFRNV